MSDDSSRQRSTFLLLATAGLVSGLTIRVAEPLLPSVAASFSVSVVSASGIVTGFTFAYGAFQLAHGSFGDRFGKLRVASIMLFLAGLASFACASSDSITALMFFRFCTGMTGGALIPLSFAWIGDHFAYEQRQRVLAKFISGVLIGQSLGPLLGGASTDLIGWRAAFALLGALYCFIGVCLYLRVRADPVPPQTLKTQGAVATYWAVAAQKSVRRICGAVAVEGCLFFGAFAYVGVFMKQQFQLSYTVIGVLIAGFGLGGLIYSFSSRRLLRRLGEKGLVRFGGIGLAGGFVLLGWGNELAVAVSLVMVGLAFYMFHNTLQTHATEMAPHARGSAVALFAFSFFVGQALGAVAFGALARGIGFTASFAFVGIGLLGLSVWFSRFCASPPVTERQATS
ncbi:MAG: MFS transporter [Gammaproteobacteria bacterium]|nr:MFS transporter [Gammaproteobacteria bacterium]